MNNERRPIRQGGHFCIPIRAQHDEEAIKKIKLAQPLADFLEIRIDSMQFFCSSALIKASEVPLLFTYRSVSEGGGGDASPEKICLYLKEAAAQGARFIDIELDLPREIRNEIMSAKKDAACVVSKHILDGTPSYLTLTRIMEDAVEAGADVVKIVTRALKWGDNFRVLELIEEAGTIPIPIIAFCMGSVGTISRVTAHVMGAFMTFVSLEKGEESAEGQLPIATMKRILRQMGYET